MQRLRSEETTDSAAQQILESAKSNPDAKLYVAKQLPVIIERNPYDSFKPWKNAVRLAGELKIVEATHALAKWIAVAEGDELSTPLCSALETNPAAGALSKIGDPAVAALKQALARDKWQDRRIAIVVLESLGSTNAKSALREHLKVETDPVLHERIERALFPSAPSSGGSVSP